jgi:hypothetical protein
VPYFIFIAVNWEGILPRLAKSYLVLRKYNSKIDIALLEVLSLKKSPITCSQLGRISMTVSGGRRATLCGTFPWSIGLVSSVV